MPADNGRAPEPHRCKSAHTYFESLLLEPELKNVEYCVNQVLTNEKTEQNAV